MSLVGIEFKFPDWERKFKSAQNEIDLFIAAQMQTNRGMLFDSEGSYNGREKWAPLTMRNGQILSDRGNLRKSMAPYNSKGSPGPDGIVKISGETITIGTQLAYAAMMNWGTTKLPGGILTPKNAKALRIPLPAGKKATPTAQELRKNSVGKAGLQRRIESIKNDLARAHDPDRKSKLQAMLDKAVKSYNTGPKNQRYIFVKSVKIPARPFNEWNEADQLELETALRNKLVEVLNR